MNVWKRYGARETVIDGKWGALPQEKTVENRNGIKVPANWQYNSFWFADVDQIEREMEPSAGKLQTGRADQSGNRGPGSSFAGDA